MLSCQLLTSAIRWELYASMRVVATETMGSNFFQTFSANFAVSAETTVPLWVSNICKSFGAQGSIPTSSCGLFPINQIKKIIEENCLFDNFNFSLDANFELQ